MSELDANQRHNPSSQQLATEITSGHFPSNEYQHSRPFLDQDHSRQCLEYNRNKFQLPLQQEPPTQPIDQTWASAYDRSAALELRSGLDYKMEDVSNINGGKMMEVEDSKESAPGIMGTAQPPEATTVVHRSDGRSNEFSVMHDCCNSLCLTRRHISHAQLEKKIMKPVRVTIVHDKQQDSMNAEMSQNKDNLRKDKVEDLTRRVKEKDEELRMQVEELRKQVEELRKQEEELRKKDERLRKQEEELRDAREQRKSDKVGIARLRADLQYSRTTYESHGSQVSNLTTKVAKYKAIADRLTEQFSTLELSNSKSVGGTGAHKDSHAIPPNLVKSVFIVNEAAVACTKTFFTFLKERKALQNHLALKNMPEGANEKYRKYKVESYLCSLLFAGFENDTYADSLDCAQGSLFLSANYESEFFLQNQDLEKRNQRYAEEYDFLQKLGLQEVMDVLKTNKPARHTNPFQQFCCRKLVKLVTSSDGMLEEFKFLHTRDSSKHSILHQLATNPKYCDKFLKPFVNLAMAAFLLHRLAFQFQPPARIFRYAHGTKFDRTYMENAVHIDDDDSDKEFVVGLMLVPGFQVGATIVKCTVHLVPSGTVKTPSSDHTC